MTDEQFSQMMSVLQANREVEIWILGGIFVLVGLLTILAFFIGMGAGQSD